MDVVPGLDMAVSREIILAQVESSLANCLIGDNFERLPDPVLSRARAQIYAARKVTSHAVELFRYPEGARLFGDRYYLLECGGVLAKEQVPPANVLPDRGAIPGMAAQTAERVRIEDPCVLVSRYGIMVWGHWIAELLPRILLTERAFPGRFKYVLPLALAHPSAPRNVWNSIGDTIRLLGIDRDRLVLTRLGRHFVFANLYGVTPILGNHAFHPEAVSAFRSAYVPDPPKRAGRKIAILRTESKNRNVSNIADIIPLLRKRNYEFVEVGTIPFQEQAYLFSTASAIVGVLASGLTGMLFAGDGFAALSVAPKGYINRFFYPIMQAKSARYYDVRGDITKQDPRGALFSDYDIDLVEFARALDRIERK